MAKKKRTSNETCAICGCSIHHNGDYAKPSVKGRSHATRHHCVAERFFGRSRNRTGTQRNAIFKDSAWPDQKTTIILSCYECHEELLHNPVFLEEDVCCFASLVKKRQLKEDRKRASREKIAGRVRLLHEVIEAGLKRLAKE